MSIPALLETCICYGLCRGGKKKKKWEILDNINLFLEKSIYQLLAATFSALCHVCLLRTRGPCSGPFWDTHEWIPAKLQPQHCRQPYADVLFTLISPFFSPAAILVSQNTSVSAYVHDVMTGKETKLDAAGGAAAGAEGSVATGAGI